MNENLMNVTLYIETSYNGPQRGKGAAMWLMEYKKKDGTPVTREGIITLENGTGTQATLKAMAAAADALNRKCNIRVCLAEGHVLAAYHCRWPEQWQEAGWRNSHGQLIKNADEWQQALEKMGKHRYMVLEAGHHEYQQYMQNQIKEEISHEAAG
ncbi:MAG: hypothetical protein LUD50_03030 [Clostridia bacterium]|nr:hypothetical protein [Clostridia bacterium]